MEKEPLLPSYLSPRASPHTYPTPISLCPLPEHDEISIPPVPVPLTPSELKERIIFGPSEATASAFDALTMNFTSPELPVSSSSANLETTDNHKSWLLDPNYATWTKSNLHRSKTAPAMAVINDFEHSPVPEPPDSGMNSIVRYGVVLLILYLTLGVIIYSCFKDHFKAIETHPVVDAFYFCIVTMCTIGYGDITPDSTETKLFSILFVLVGFGCIDIFLSGLVGYVLDLQENYLLRSIKGAHSQDARSYIIDVKKGRMRIRMKVTLALGAVVLCIGVGVTVLHFVEKLGWIDAFYLSVMSVTTVGYGDRAFQSMNGRIFASIWLLVSTLAVARAFLYLAESRIHRRHRKMAEWVLDQDMTVAQFLAADIDNNGFVSKSEYVIYKLKEMGLISEKDIILICKQFGRLDSGNCGRITLADLMEHHH